MGWQDRDYARRPGHLQLRGRVVIVLIVATVVAWLIQGLLFGRGNRTDLSLTFGVVPERLLQGWVWQLVTHAFLHHVGAVQHLLFNMLFLYWLGTDVAEIYGPRKFLALYSGGAVLCGLVFTAACLLAGEPQHVGIGASGAIAAVSVVAAFYFPTRQILFMFFIPMPLWVLVAGYVGLDLYYLVANLQPWPSSAGHLGGALFGLIFWFVTTRRGFNFRLALRMPKMSFSSKPTREEVDRILDKINAQGIGSLTDGERKTLKRASE